MKSVIILIAIFTILFGFNLKKSEKNLYGDFNNIETSLNEVIEFSSDIEPQIQPASIEVESNESSSMVFKTRAFFSKKHTNIQILFSIYAHAPPHKHVA
jgi:glycine cleavage system regulatory protein